MPYMASATARDSLSPESPIVRPAPSIAPLVKLTTERVGKVASPAICAILLSRLALSSDK